jgi:hypothetical protein
MSTSCYEIAFEHATNEIAEIDAEIERLTNRKELLEKLLEPLKLLVRESGSGAFPSRVLEGSNTESAATETAAQVSPVVLLMDVSEPEPGLSEASVPMMEPEVDETNVDDAMGNRGSISNEEVAELAYRFWNERGQVHGYHQTDWFRAAHELQNSADSPEQDNAAER